jgi:hypothetical protein
MGKRALQIMTAILGLIPVVTGVVGMFGLNDPLYASLDLPRSAVLDSNMRFFAGVWLSLGLSLLWCVPRVDSQGTLFRAVWVMIFIGGVGRLLSLALVGLPPAPFLGFTALEVIGAPLFILWQSRIATPKTVRK